MGKKSSAQSQLKLMQAALDHINQGFSVMDKDLRLVGWNKRFFELLDLPESLAKRGTHFSEFIRYNAEREEYGRGDIDKLVAERVEKAMAFESHSFVRERPSGEMISIRGTPLPEGGFVTTYTDVTSQKQREDALEKAVAERTSALRESEQRLRLITNAIPALIAYIDTEPSFTFANQRYAEWFGWTVEGMLGKPATEVVGKSLYRELEPQITRALAGTETTYEYRRKGPNGQYADMRTTLLPDLDEKGEVRGCFVLSLDITEQKHHEAIQHQAEKMEAVGQLTGGVAHDFNNLLTIILGNLIGLRARTIKHPELGELVEPAIDAANRGANLVNRLLAFARGRAIDPHPVDVATVVADLSPLLRRTLPSSMDILTEVKGQSRLAMVDRSQLENALLNLALNARDAMGGHGSIRFIVSETNLGKIQAADLGLSLGHYVRIDVEDTGPGMSEDTRQRAFEPFFTTKEFGSGNGLGLSTVYGFARQSSGTVTISASGSNGACLTLYLPCTDMAENMPETDGVETAIATVRSGLGMGALVLLVEDDIGVRAIVRRQLNDLGYSVLEAEEAQEALDMVKSIDDIRYLVSDIVMPGTMNGIALAEQAKEIAPAIKVGLISGYAEGFLDKDFSDCPFPILPKPFATEALAGLMGQLV